jgi:RNase P subunit RPR2
MKARQSVDSKTKGICPKCGEEKRLSTNHPTDETKGRVCSGCYRRLTDPMAACSECGEEKRLSYNHPTDETKGRVCGGCYQRLTKPVGACSECGEEKRLSYNHPSVPEKAGPTYVPQSGPGRRDMTNRNRL